LKINPTSAKRHQNKIFESAPKGEAARAHHYFYSVAGAGTPLLNLADSDSGSSYTQWRF